MGKFGVGDLVVIADPCLNSQECYRGFVRRIHSTDENGSYYFEDITYEDGDMIPWVGYELAKVEGETTPLIGNDTVCSLKYCMNDITITKEYVENKEEKEMNKILNLWYDRKRKAIKKRYDNLREEFNEQYGSIQSFNELVDKFNKDLEELYNYDKATEQFVLTENAPSNVIKYKVDTNRIDDYFNKMYREKIKQDYQEIDDIKEEVEAQLSLSNDLEYQRKILKKYGIINKVTEKISE